MIAYTPSFAGRWVAARVRVLLRIPLSISCDCSSTAGRLRAWEILTFVANTSRRGVLHTFPSTTNVSLFPEAPLVHRRSLNLIWRAKRRGGWLIPTWTVLEVRISQDAACEDPGSKQRWTSHRWGDKWEEGVFFFLFPFFSFFFFIMYSLFIVQETAWSANYGVNKTVNNPTTRFTPSWEKSNPSNPEHRPLPDST